MNRTTFLSLLACSAFTCSAFACSGDDDGPSDTQAGTLTSGGDSTESGDMFAFLPWLESGNYTDWAAESGVHPSAGPHGGVRTFVNDTLLDSMAMSANVHPPSSSAVKELYSGETLIGWAVSLRLDDGPGAEAWYWYELLNGNVIADGTEVDLCANCHADGDDYVLTPFPLQ